MRDQEDIEVWRSLFEALGMPADSPTKWQWVLDKAANTRDDLARVQRDLTRALRENATLGDDLFAAKARIAFLERQCNEALNQRDEQEYLHARSEYRERHAVAASDAAIARATTAETAFARVTHELARTQADLKAEQEKLKAGASPCSHCEPAMRCPNEAVAQGAPAPKSAASVAEVIDTSLALLERDAAIRERDDARRRCDSAVAEGRDFFHRSCELLEENKRAIARAEQAERDRDAYKKAKAENDERFMLERDAVIRERDEAQGHLSRLLSLDVELISADLAAANAENTRLREALVVIAERAHDCDQLGPANSTDWSQLETIAKEAIPPPPPRPAPDPRKELIRELKRALEKAEKYLCDLADQATRGIVPFQVTEALAVLQAALAAPTKPIAKGESEESATCECGHPRSMHKPSGVDQLDCFERGGDGKFCPCARFKPPAAAAIRDEDKT